MSCHVMSCHVMSCRHYCIEFLKKSFSKTFLFLKIIYKYFAGFSLLAIIRIATLPLAMTRLYAVITRATPEVIYSLDCFITFAMTRWFTFNLISFRDLSLLFIKKFITKGDLNYVKSQNNF